MLVQEHGGGTSCFAAITVHYGKRVDQRIEGSNRMLEGTSLPRIDEAQIESVDLSKHVPVRV